MLLNEDSYEPTSVKTDCELNEHKKMLKNTGDEALQ